MTRFGAAVVCALSLLSAASAPALAAGYPSLKPIKFVVPLPPGGGADVLARIVAQKLSVRLKQTIVIENKSGAGGTIGARDVARAEPDGYTILVGYTGTHGVSARLGNSSYNPRTDFMPIAQFADSQQVLVVNPEVKATSVPELTALLKQKPDQLNYASAGNGSAPHLAAEMYKQLTGTGMVHIIYKGSAPAVLDTVAGRTQVMFPSLPAAISMIKGGRLRALAVTGSSRSSHLPDVPTVKETGLTDLESVQWFGLFAPSNTPRENGDIVAKELEALLKEPDVVSALDLQGAEVRFRRASEFSAFVENDTSRWLQVVQKAGIKFH
jgi:tripartite-type tricarboxylate transporter receptor subunit TctC